jgi:CBS domain containing-hemolysin-like protein
VIVIGVIGAAGLVFAVIAASVGVAAATVSQLELTRWVQYRLRGADVAAQLRDNPGRLVATANALTTIGLVLAAGALPAGAALGAPRAVGVGVALVAIPVFLACAYLVPRVAGRRWAEPLATRAVPWMDRAARWLGPLLPHRDPSPRSALAAMLAGSEAHALSTSDELALVSGVLAFSARQVREIMTPRTEVVAIPEGLLVGEAAHLFGQSGYSRYPVYRGSLDDVVGVVHAFDLLHRQPDEPVPVRPALLVPGTTSCGDVLREMQRGRGHLALVLDEYGGTAGVVTFDDLLRDLVAELFEGPIAPSADQAPEPAVAEVLGSEPAADLAERFGVAFGSRDVQTIGGLLAQRLGRIPRAGERFQFAGLEFDVLQATVTRVERLLVRRAPVRVIPLEGGREA